METMENVNMGILWIALFTLCFAQYEAYRLDKHYWIGRKEKQMSWLFRLFVVIAASGKNPYLFLSYSFFMAGTYDLLLNWLRKDVDDTWHLGTTAKWDLFWMDKMGAYKSMRVILPILAIVFYVLSFYYTELPFNY